MFYKIESGSKLHEELKTVKLQCDAAFEATRKFVFKRMKVLGFNVASYRQGKKDSAGSFYQNTLAGGVVAFDISEGRPKGWKNTGSQGYYPQNIKANKELLEEIQALPFVDEQAVSKIIGFKTAHDDNSNKVLFNPGMRLSKDDNPHVVCFSDWVIPKHYKPLKDMVEITKTEYDNIAKRK